VEGRLPADWRRGSVIVGPLAFAYGRQLLPDERRRGLVDEKMLIVLEAGHEATVAVPASHQRRVSLDYELTRRNHFPPRVSDGVPSVRFVACRSDAKSFSPTHSLRRETQFNGGIIARWPSCVPLDVFIDGRDTPERATISFGAGRCA
jgi:hypothetical protein